FTGKCSRIKPSRPLLRGQERSAAILLHDFWRMPLTSRWSTVPGRNKHNRDDNEAISQVGRRQPGGSFTGRRPAVCQLLVLQAAVDRLVLYPRFSEVQP